MNEEFLYYVWQYKLFTKDIETTNGEQITILKSGVLNHDSGPDFFNSKVKIGQTLWVGNVEIHINSSDWNKHKHQFDKSYDNVILHVVYNDDVEIENQRGAAIPTLELKNFLLPKSELNYNNLISNNGKILCKRFLPEIDPFIWFSWKERLLIQRLSNKSQIVEQIYAQSNNDWTSTFFILLSKYFGQKVNQLPFELLAKSLDFKIIEKCKDDRIKIDALVFGQAGLLEDAFKDEYPNTLKSEYLFLSKKYNLIPLDKSLWKYLRLRPANFPTIRLAQFSSLLLKFSNLFSLLTEANSIESLHKLFVVKIDNYWNSHYQLDVMSLTKEKNLGIASIDVILINVVIPILFVYGKLKGEITIQEKAIDLYSQIKPENNSIIKNWKELNILAKSAYDTQTLIELYDNYCSQKKCLKCEIGIKVLQQE